jgi:SHS family sialic acid transporter-like MFS transporter
MKRHEQPAEMAAFPSDAPDARARWLALTAALLGWLFDGAEMGLFSMVGRPAVKDLLATSDEARIGLWFGIITTGFLVGAATGGVLFGWLGDRVGRVRAMTLSVLTYAIFTGLCGVATSAWQVGALRFIAALGMGGEWSLGVALVMEVWPNRSRAFMAGLIGAAANVGYLLVGFVGLALAAVLSEMEGWLLGCGLSEQIVQRLVANSGWRLMMLTGTLPALLTFFIRMFVPESQRWRREESRGATVHWAPVDLLGIVLGLAGPAIIVYLWAPRAPEQGPFPLATQLIGTLIGLLIVTAGYSYPLVRYLQRQAKSVDARQPWQPTLRRMLMGAVLSGVALLGTWGSTQWAPSWADKLTDSETKAGVIRHAREYTQIALAAGAILGTISAALVGDWLGRRVTYFLLCLLSLAAVYVFFLTNHAYGWPFLFWAFVVGATTAAFYGWLPLYLPELFRTNIRATGQGFGFNFGRILAAIGVLQTGNLMSQFQDGFTVAGFTLPAGYPSACSVMSLIYLVGAVFIWFCPETKGRPLPE